MLWSLRRIPRSSCTACRPSTIPIQRSEHRLQRSSESMRWKLRTKCLSRLSHWCSRRRRTACIPSRPWWRLRCKEAAEQDRKNKKWSGNEIWNLRYWRFCGNAGIMCRGRSCVNVLTYPVLRYGKQSDSWRKRATASRRCRTGDICWQRAMRCSGSMSWRAGWIRNGRDIRWSFTTPWAPPICRRRWTRRTEPGRGRWSLRICRQPGEDEREGHGAARRGQTYILRWYWSPNLQWSCLPWWRWSWVWQWQRASGR